MHPRITQFEDLKHTSGEEDRLRRCIRDIVALSALPAAWHGQSPQSISDKLAEVLATMLFADFAYISFREPLRPTFYRNKKWESLLSLEAVEKALQQSLDVDQAEMITFDLKADGNLFSVCVSRLGLSPCQGWIVIGAGRPSFPSKEEKLVLALASTQTSTYLARFSAQHALKRSEDRYKFAALATRDAIWDWNLVTNHVDWNEALHSEYGYPRSLMQGDANWWVEHIHSDDRERVSRSIHDVIDSKDGLHWADEYRFMKSDGSYLHILDRGYVVRNELGRPKRMIGAMQDVTERVLAGRQIEKKSEQLRSTIEDLQNERGLRERFVTALSHDLRTPLTAARLSAQLLNRRANDPEAIKKASSRISSSMSYADRMIQNLLDATRIRAGEKMHGTMQECSLRDILTSAVEQLQTIYGDRFVLIRESETASTGFWDPSGIERIIENLAANAVKYGSSDSPITIHYRTDANSAFFSVHNFGNVISPHDQGQLFAPYHRAHTALSSGQKGWGIGLTLVKEIVEAHGGTVWLESSKDQGTYFYVRLPLDRRNSS